jgi:8-oxo-dGTP diphosphatase
MTRDGSGHRALDAAVADARVATAEFDGARQWLASARAHLMPVLAAEVWVFDEELDHVVLVRHRWRAWVPPGGKVEPGETPRGGAIRELFEETGVRAEPLARPAAVAIRSFHPDWPVTAALSYAAIVPASTPLVAEPGQPVAWTRLDGDWESYFPEDPSRIRQYVASLARGDLI